MEKFSLDIEQHKHAVLSNDAIEYVRVNGSVDVKDGNRIHYISICSGGLADVYSLSGINHLDACSGSKIVLHKWENTGCAIWLHRGGTIVNNTTIPTEDLVRRFDLSDDMVGFKVKTVINGNVITGVKPI